MLVVRDVAEEAEAQVPAQGDDVQVLAVEEVVSEVVLPTPTSSSPPSLVIPSPPLHQPPCPPQPQDAEGRKIADMDQDEGIELVANQEKDAEVEGRHADKQAELYNLDQDHSSKVLSMQENDTEAQEAEDLRKRLEIVQDEDDDVFVEATPLAQKVPVVDYQIVVIDNKPMYKIIRADDTHQLYISFTTLLKNFDREDLETLWRITNNAGYHTSNVKRSGDVTRLQALVDKKKIVISEAVIREILQLNDAEGMTNIADLSTHTTRYISPALTQKVFENMRRVRKGFSGVETPLFESMLVVRDVAKEAEAHVLAQGYDVQVPAAEEVVDEVVLPTPTSSSPPSLVIPSPPLHQPPCPPQPQDAEVPSFLFQRVLDTCSALARRVEGLENDKAAQQLEIVKLKARGRKITDMDQDEGIELVADQEKDVEVEGRHADKQAELYKLDQDHSSKVLSMQEDDTEAQKAEDLRKRLEIVHDEDDDVFVEATPLSQKTMFEEPDGQDAIWRNQKSVHGLALVKRWKQLTSCGVHVITLSIVQLFLLVERRYPLLRFTLEQLVSVARLQVKEESEMYLELLSKSKDCQSNIDAVRLKLKLFKNIAAAKDITK
nr:hypothetical protein [Tanacetum cinerariifolium]